MNGGGATDEEKVVAVMEAVLRAARKYGRDDLVGELTSVRRDLARLATNVIVVGEHNAGKSLLINALVAHDACASDPATASAVPTTLTFAAEPFAVVDRPASGLHDADRVVTTAEAIAAQTVHPVGDDPVSGVRLGVPSALLQSGIGFTDTPPWGAPQSTDAAALSLLVRHCSGAIVVLDASRELTRSALGHIDHIAARAVPTICVMTKIDFYPEWRAVLERSRENLAAAGHPQIPIFPVSSTLRIQGSKDRDDSLLGESGFEPLLRWLDDLAKSDVASVRHQAALSVAAETTSDLLVAPLTERRSLMDPATTAELERRATTAAGRADALRSASARWATVLSDATSDLSSTVDLQLRTRLRAVLAEVEAMIDETDPAESSDQLLPAIESRFMDEVAALQVTIEDHAVNIAQRVAEVFDEDAAAADLTDLAIPNEAAIFDPTARGAVEVTEVPGLGASLLTGVRGSYSGIAIFGMAGGLLAPALGALMIGPLSLVAGAIMGRKLITDERKRQLTGRRNEAKAAIRRYSDEATLHVSKHCRDAIQHVHRTLRDQNLARATSLVEAANAARDATQRALRENAATTEQRVRALDTTIAELRTIESAIATLAS